ncbi:MAG: hypothetical protein LBL17_00595 [Coxiellaceae bacterium]|jgi:hypothetical protein|nr:hypothetical protein [Coxiellaceae bacterium]
MKNVEDLKELVDLDREIIITFDDLKTQVETEANTKILPLEQKRMDIAMVDCLLRRELETIAKDITDLQSKQTKQVDDIIKDIAPSSS